jgi:hypothetical protein
VDIFFDWKGKLVATAQFDTLFLQPTNNEEATYQAFQSEIEW